MQKAQIERKGIHLHCFATNFAILAEIAQFLLVP